MEYLQFQTKAGIMKNKHGKTIHQKKQRVQNRKLAIKWIKNGKEKDLGDGD